MAVRLERWSYSTWSGFKECPRKVRYQKIDKLEEPKHPAMVRGDTIHKKAEYFLKGEIRGVPHELRKLGPEYKELKKQKPEHIEEFWGFDGNWKPLRKGFSPKQKFTIKADVALAPRKGIAICIDHKTGRIYDGHDDQAELTAIATRLWYPSARGIEVEFWYIDRGDIYTYSFTTKYLDRRIPYWTKQGQKIMSEEKFLPTPSEFACGRCNFRSDKGGPCTAWKKI